jgi:hypothetical protein
MELEAIRITSILSVLIPLGFYVKRWKSLPPETHILGVLLTFYLTMDAVIYFMSTRQQPTAAIFNVGQLIQFGLISWFYYLVMFNRVNKNAFMITIIAFGIFAGIVALVYQGVFQNQTLVWSMAALAIVFFAVMFFNDLVIHPPILDKNLYSLLFTNGAFLLYFGFNLFLFLISDFVLTKMDPEMGKLVWSFHNINNIIKNIALAFGIHYIGKRVIEATQKELELLKTLK